MTARERVWRVVRAASTLELDETLIHRITQSSGLSHEGVRLALERHLETSPAEEDIRHLVAGATHAEVVHVLLSSTVFTSALRAIALAWAAAPRVVVRPSHREPHFAAALTRAIDDEAVTLAPDLDVRQIEHGEIHVYGRMETIQRVREGARKNVVVRAHGPGMGIAVVGENADLETAAADLADDVVAFDQRGCLSPRVVFAFSRAQQLAEALAVALDAEVPLGSLTEEERGEAARWIQTLSFAGAVKRGPGGVVAVSDRIVIPPSGRHVDVVSGPPLVDDIAKHVTAVGLTEDVDVAFAPAHARVSPLGRMQCPPLDGPVDRRTA